MPDKQSEIEKVVEQDNVSKILHELDIDLRTFSVYLNQQILGFIARKELVKETRRHLEDLFGDVDRAKKAVQHHADKWVRVNSEADLPKEAGDYLTRDIERDEVNISVFDFGDGMREIWLNEVKAYMPIPPFTGGNTNENA